MTSSAAQPTVSALLARAAQLSLATGVAVFGIKLAGYFLTGSVGLLSDALESTVNVAAALALAGVGPARTRVRIWADPGIDRNIHTIEVEADAARFTMRIENVPTDDNPRTGKLVALSVLACLRGLVSPLKIGS